MVPKVNSSPEAINTNRRALADTAGNSCAVEVEGPAGGRGDVASDIEAILGVLFCRCRSGTA